LIGKQAADMSIKAPDIADRMPTRHVCEKLMVENAMLRNIFTHFVKVTEVSRGIADNLKKPLA
jgi:hypothetical protein